ncbi:MULTISPECIES: hypothetical protein [Calditerrivibrio]|jgi:hypothetical protein|uniref:Uncharacterized protein n=1 Tax=Calditerrivibrio nitroreducens TaxID=477976 RepID=A0A2J6WMI7_9BACT|nr:MAG: hypothetical protein C0187_03645 [Calditerrivibrio nitroreducens]
MLIGRKERLFLALFLFLDILFAALLITLHSDTIKIDRMKNDVKLVGLPDTALVTEARFVRHRSLTDVYSIFDFSPEAREVFPFSFVYDINNNTKGQHR